MRLFRKWAVPFSRDKYLRAHLLFDIFVSFIYKRFRANYIEIYDLERSEHDSPVQQDERTKVNKSSEIRRQSECNPHLLDDSSDSHQTSASLVERSLLAPSSSGEFDNHSHPESNSTYVDETADYHWDTVPKLNRFADLYFSTSTIYMIYMLVRDLLPFKEMLNNFKLELPARCYVVGRFVFSGSMNKVIGILLCCLQLSWRLFQIFRPDTYRLKFVYFMIQQEPNLVKLYKLIDHCNTADVDPKPPRGIQKLALDCSCYHIRKHNKNLLRLRPNRTYESYKRIAATMSRTLLFSMIEFGILFTIVFSYVIFSLIQVERYLFEYPGCYPELESKAFTFWTVELTGHHAITFWADGFDCLFIYMDAGVIVTFVVDLVYLLNKDLLIYWSHMHGRVVYTLEKTQEYWLSRQTDSDRFLFGHFPKTMEDSLQYELKCIEMRSSIKDDRSSDQALLPNLATPWAGRQFRGIPFELEDLIAETQAEIFDFFHQVAETDRFVSDVIRMVILIWLSSFTLIYYYPMATGTEPSQSGTLFQIFGLVVAGTIMIALAELHRCTAKTYKSICSLMAYDQSSHKKSFLRILEFYSARGKSSFTLFQNYHLTTTTFLSMVGWTVSCFIILENLFRESK